MAGLAALYLAIMGGRMYSFDGFLVYRQAQALAFEQSVHFSPFEFGGGRFTTSFYGPGASLVQIPTLLLFSALRSPKDTEVNFYHQPLFAVAVDPLFIVITVLTALLVWKFIKALGLDNRTALWGFLFFGIGSPAIVYARGDFAQPLAGLCWMAGLYTTLRFFQQPGVKWLLLACLAIFYAVITRPVEGTLLAAAMLTVPIFWLRATSSPREIWYFLISVGQAFALAWLVTLAWNSLRYGSLFETGVPTSWSTPLRTGLPGALISPGRGMIWSFPAILLAPFGVYKLWSARHRALAVALSGLVLAHLINVAKWRVWWGGMNWGLRIFFTALPVIAVLAALGVNALPRKHRRLVPLLLLLGGVVWAVPCIVTDLFTSSADGDSAGSFWWSSYPPIGAWRGLHHIFATNIGDPNAVDIVWFRYAHLTNYTTLLVLLLLLLVAGLLFRQCFRLIRLMEAEQQAQPASRPS